MVGKRGFVKFWCVSHRRVDLEGGVFNHRYICEGMDKNRNKHGLFFVLVRIIMVRKRKNKYLTRFIWIVMGGCMRDEVNGRLSKNQYWI